MRETSFSLYTLLCYLKFFKQYVHWDFAWNPAPIKRMSSNICYSSFQTYFYGNKWKLCIYLHMRTIILYIFLSSLIGLHLSSLMSFHNAASQQRLLSLLNLPAFPKFSELFTLPLPFLYCPHPHSWWSCFPHPQCTVIPSATKILSLTFAGPEEMPGRWGGGWRVKEWAFCQ